MHRHFYNYKKFFTYSRELMMNRLKRMKFVIRFLDCICRSCKILSEKFAQDYSYCGGHYRDHYFNQIFPQNAISWEIADARPRGERVRRYYEINLVIAWSRKKSGRSVLIKELEASAAPCQQLPGFPSIPLFFYLCIATDIVYVYVIKLAELMKKLVGWKKNTS